MKRQEKKFPTRVFNAYLIGSDMSKRYEVAYTKSTNLDAPLHYWKPPVWLQDILRGRFERGKSAGIQEVQQKLKDLLNIDEGDGRS